MLEEKYGKTKNLHGYSIMKNNVGIFGAGYATNAGPFWASENEVFNLLKESHKKIKDAEKKIMVTHMHPKGSQAEFSGWEGSSAVAKATKKFKPDLLISGHIHEAGGLQEYLGKTKVINVARNATIFEI